LGSGNIKVGINLDIKMEVIVRLDIKMAIVTPAFALAITQEFQNGYIPEALTNS